VTTLINKHEEEFAKSFIVPAKRERYLTLLETAKGRSKLVSGFDHHSDLDMRFAKLIPKGQHSAKGIEKILREKGAPEVCHVMSSNPNIDNREMPLAEALSETVGYGCGTLISCMPGKLGYFEFEDMGERYILEK
jgi:hypothetical protein